ncbi:hypothetical protein [Gemmatimonas phototrophica]|nr:hypothetical protein [Gemmatimonas phototrophica]
MLTCAISAAAAMLAAMGHLAGAFGFAAAAALLLLWAARSVTGHWSALAVLFVGFFALYGLSGPLNVIAGAPLADIFAFPYRTTDYLQQQSLATLGLALGFSAFSLRSAVRAPQHTDATAGCASPANAPDALGIPFSTALLCLGLASAFEIVTFLRVGGLPALALGKAVYQSRASDLSMSLPSIELASFGFGLAAMWFAENSSRQDRIDRLRRAGLILLFALPVLGVALALGRRGPLFGWALVWIVGRSIYKPFRTIPPRLVLAAVALVTASGVLFAGRATLAFGVATGDWAPFLNTVTDAPRVIEAINPAGSEFGATFGNFSEYAMRANESPRLGDTYVAGLSTLIPQVLYPGQKPRTITYEFRDTFFPTEAARGAIASTGFSSIMEAYMNFRDAGVVLVYVVVGVVLLLTEQLRVAGPYSALFYLQLIPITQVFHRSELSLPLGVACLSLFLVLVVRGAALVLALLTAGTSLSPRGGLHA